MVVLHGSERLARRPATNGPPGIVISRLAVPVHIAFGRPITVSVPCGDPVAVALGNTIGISEVDASAFRFCIRAGAVGISDAVIPAAPAAESILGCRRVGDSDAVADLWTGGHE